MQLEAIPHIIRGSDAAVQSYTGSGKVSSMRPSCAACERQTRMLVRALSGTVC